MIAVKDWAALLRQFKERLAQRLWGIPGVSETEKEVVFKEYLSDLTEFETDCQSVLDEFQSKERTLKDENELLRSLLGVKEDDLKMKLLTVSQEAHDLKEQIARREEDTSAANASLHEKDNENRELRERVRDLEKNADYFRSSQIRKREEDLRYFSEANEGLRTQLKDLETRIGNLRALYADSNKKLLTEKQEEVALLQKKLLDEMEAALRKKQELSWGEEEMFAKGVAHRVRTTLVSAQGQLFLTLERLGLMDPNTKTESFWKSRLHLLMNGADELSKNFRAVQAQLQEVTGALDDYLHLTGRREITRVPVSLKDVVQKEMAELYQDRRPTLSVEFLCDDPLPMIDGDPSLLKFVVHELLKNALEALPNESGKIVISLQHRSDKGQVQLLVKDSGNGIPEHLRPRLFQPFFSTKEHRQGLSLSRVKRYVEFHDGELELVSTGPQGTTFQAEFPASGAR